jgi:cholesterol transport system auxiliary component
MKVDAGRAAFIVLCVVLFSGCALFSPVKTDTKQYALNR